MKLPKTMSEAQQSQWERLLEAYYDKLEEKCIEVYDIMALDGQGHYERVMKDEYINPSLEEVVETVHENDSFMTKDWTYRLFGKVN